MCNRILLTCIIAISHAIIMCLITANKYLFSVLVNNFCITNTVWRKFLMVENFDEAGLGKV